MPTAINVRAFAPPKQVTLRACGKLNLALQVNHRRDDGFHEIDSPIVGISLFDTIRLTTTNEGGIQCPGGLGFPGGSDNLAWQAATRCGQERASAHARIDIRKRIPVGGGLGGGSSDAASTIKGCNELWSLGWDDEQMIRVGAAIGSDVPLFFRLPSARIRGRGEIVTGTPMGWTGWASLASVPGGVSTAAVYAAFQRSDRRTDLAGRLDEILSARHAAQLNELAHNDLASAVFRVAPRVARTVSIIQQAGLGPVCVSGAGSTVFRLFDHREEAEEHVHWVGQLGLDLFTTVVSCPVAA